MDPPDSTELNLNLCDLNDSEIFGPEPNMQHEYNDDIFQDLFALSNELKESVVADQLEYGHKMKSCPENPDSEKDLKSASNIVDKDPDFHVSTMIEKLKQQNKELKEKCLKQECELVQYEEKLSEKMNDLLKVQMERDSLKENLRLADDERALLKLKVEEKEAELIQFKCLIKERLVEEEGIEALKKQLSNETKLLKKTEKDLQRNTDLLSKSRERLRLLRKRNKKLASTVLAFGELLEHKELLSATRKKYLESVRKEFKVDDETSIDDSSSEDEMVEVNRLDEASSLKGNHIPVSNGLIKNEETSHSNGLPVDCNIKSDVSSPVKNAVISPISPIMCKTEETSSGAPNEVTTHDKTNRLSPDSNFQSFASGTESLCSEDMDITDECFAEIKEGIEGWVLKTENYAPLSPLPPTPPPNNSKQRRIPRRELITKTDNSDKLTPFSSVSTSKETLSECSEKAVSDKSSSLLMGESDKTESSDMPIPFSIVPCFDQQITPSPQVSYEYLKKKTVLCPQNSSTSETESGVTKSTTKVVQNSESSLNQQVTPLSPESSECIGKENVPSPQTSSNSDSIKSKDSDPFIPFSNATNQNTIPASPESSSAYIQKENVLSPQTYSDSEKNKDSDHFIPFTNPTNQNTIPASPESSSTCFQKKNILSHQNSKGFEPHIEENSEKSIMNNSTVSESFVSPPVIPPELHYLSSSYSENNSFKILHQGSSVYDYLVNPETKLSVCILTLNPKMASLGTASPSNSAVKNANMLPHEEERKKRVLSLYQATEKRVTLVKNQIIGSGSSGFPNNMPIETLPRVCVIVESENDVSVDTVGNNSLPENVNDSGMVLDDTTVDDVEKDNTEGVKGQTDENQYLVSSSCDVSTPSKRKLTSSSFKHHANIQSQLTNKKRCTKSHGPSMEVHQKDETVPVSDTISRKKRSTENIDDVSCKKIKTELLNDIEEEIILPQDVSFSTKINPMSPKKPTLNLKCPPSDSQLLSSKDCPQLENQNSPVQNEPLANVLSPELFSRSLNTSPSKNSLLFGVFSPKKEFKNSSEKELLSKVSSPSLGLNESPENKTSPEVNSLQSKLKNSPLKNKHILNISSPENEQQKSQLNCVSISHITSPPLKNSPENCQLLSEDNSHLLQHKNSPLKSQQSKVSNLEKEQQKSQLNCVSHITSPPLKNSPENCQPLSDDNSQLKNSPLKSQLVSKISSPEQEQQNSQSNCSSILNVNRPHLKHKNKHKKSSLKIKPESNVSSPNQEQQNSQLNCVSSVGANNLQLKLKNSPEKSQPLSEDNSNLLQHKNSPLKNQLVSKVSNLEQEQQNSQSNCPSVLSINSPQLKLKHSPEKCQPLSVDNSSLLQHKNSSLKIEHESNVSSPNQKQQNSHLNCVSSLGANNPQVKLKNKPERCQLLSEGNGHLLEYKNSLENHLLSNVCSPQLELEISPSENQPSSDVSSAEHGSKNDILTKSGISDLELENCPSKFHPTSIVNSPFELKNSPLQTKHFDSIRSPDFDFEENSLIIDEDVTQEDEHQINNSDCLSIESNKCIDSGNESSITTPEKKPKSKKKKASLNKKKKNKAPTKNAKKNSSSAEEEPVNIVISIPIVLKQIDEVKIHDSFSEFHFKRYAHTLLSAIINPSNAFSTRSVLYQIFNHLRFSRTNPLVSFPIECNISVFFPLTEKCIVSALIQAQRKKKSHLEGLITTAINNLYLLVLSKESITKTGLGAFCRVFTALCKDVKNREKPVKLCCELIKARHKFAPILIASIVGVWPELFAVTDETPTEEVLLHGSIAYGLEKKPPALTSADWKQCKTVFNKYLKSPPIADVNETTRNLIEILEEFMEEHSREDEYMMTDQLLMYAACNGWKWAEENLSYFILPSLAKYAQQKDDERAFSLFCNLYADISLLCPNFEASSEILEQLFILKEAFSYVKGCAARSMIKLYLLSKHKFPSCLYDWTRENESMLLGTPTELLLKQRLMSDVSSFSEDDIISP